MEIDRTTNQPASHWPGVPLTPADRRC